MPKIKDVLYLPSVVGTLLIIACVSLPYWREYKVNTTLAARMKFSFVDREELEKSRCQGFYWICFEKNAPFVATGNSTTEHRPGKARKQTSYFDFGPEYKCTGVNWDFSLAESGADKEQLRLRWASFVLYMLACVLSIAGLTLTFFSFATKRPLWAVITSVVLLLIVILVSTSSIILEQCFLVEEKKLWPEGVKYFTTTSYGATYIAAWVGVACLLVSAVEMAIFAKIFKQAQKLNAKVTTEESDSEQIVFSTMPFYSA